MGKYLLLNAFARCLRVSKEVAFRAIEVEAIDDQAASFYAKYGFLPFPSDPHHLAIALETVQNAQQVRHPSVWESLCFAEGRPRVRKPWGQTLCAPWKGVDLQWVQLPPGNWVAPAGSYRSGGGGNETVGAFETNGPLWRCSEQAGRNASERRAGLETTNVGADPALDGEGRRRWRAGKRLE